MKSRPGRGAPSARMGPLARLALVVAGLALLMVALPWLRAEPSVESMVRADSPELALRAHYGERVARLQSHGMGRLDAIDAAMTPLWRRSCSLR